MSKWWDKDWFKRLAEDSDSYEELADKAGCGVTTAKRWVQRHNLEFEGNHETNSVTGDAAQKLNTREWLRAEYHSDRTLDSIASELDVDRTTVLRYVDNHGIERVGKGSNTPTGPDNPRWAGGYEQYHGPNWQTQKRRAKQRDGWECVVCGISNDSHLNKFGRGLAVHHIIPYRDFERPDGSVDYESANDLDNLTTVCFSCHGRWEGLYLMPERC